jgi:hypothetical protein
MMLLAFHAILLEFLLRLFSRHRKETIIAKSIQAVIYDGDLDPKKINNRPRLQNSADYRALGSIIEPYG